MIVFDLRCLDGGETFEGWFGSSADFDEQPERGLVAMPLLRIDRASQRRRWRRA